MIFTFGDGFATGHIWPEWPQILQALLPTKQVVNTAGIGAGPEFLVSGLVDLIPSMANNTVIFQWPYPNRFDKLIQDSSWDQVIDSSPKYNFNRVTDSGGRRWWLSSASVEPYHSKWVQPQQHTRRLEVYQTLVQNTLENIGCKFLFTSTQDIEEFSQQSRFDAMRQNHIQPSPTVQFYWLLEQVVAKLNIALDPNRVQWLEKEINSVSWIAYDPERQAQWDAIIHGK